MSLFDEHIYSTNMLPIWLFPNRRHGRERSQTGKTIFCREHQFYMGREYFQLCHMLRPQSLRRMKAREHYAKSKIEQRKVIRIQKGDWGHPEQQNSKMCIINKRKYVYELGKKWNRGQKQKRNKAKVILRKPRPNPKFELDD